MPRKKSKPPVTPPKPPQKPPAKSEPQQVEAPDTSPVSSGTTPLPDITEEQRQEIDKELHLLNSRICEFLKCYLLLGYTFDGQPVQIVSVKTQQDMDSLNHTLQRFLMASSMRQQSPNEDDFNKEAPE